MIEIQKITSKGLFGMSAYRFSLPWVDKFDETFSGYKIFLALIRQPLLFYLNISDYMKFDIFYLANFAHDDRRA